MSDDAWCIVVKEGTVLFYLNRFRDVEMGLM